MATSRSATSVLLFVANLLLPIAILQFAIGFFPYKPFLPGLATYDVLRRYGDIPRAPFNKVIFMVVDALRRYEYLPVRALLIQ
jgi:ethanolaminephosphotransferase